MYTCLCRAVSREQLVKIVREYQITSIAELRKYINIGDNCGICLETVIWEIHSQIGDSTGPMK